MREQTFTTEIMNSLKSYGFWAYKIPDAPYSRMKDAGLRFIPPKPCDIVACKDGKFYAIETKQMKKWEKLSIDTFTLSQITNMTNIVKAGGVAYAFVNVRIKKESIDELLIFKWDSHFIKALQRKKFSIESVKTHLSMYGVTPYIDPVSKKKIYDVEEMSIL